MMPSALLCLLLVLPASCSALCDISVLGIILDRTNHPVEPPVCTYLLFRECFGGVGFCAVWGVFAYSLREVPKGEILSAMHAGMYIPYSITLLFFGELAMYAFVCCVPGLLLECANQEKKMGSEPKNALNNVRIERADVVEYADQGKNVAEEEIVQIRTLQP